MRAKGLHLTGFRVVSIIRPSCVFGSVAQLVEQRAFNPLVESSNLSRPTKTLPILVEALVGGYSVGR